MRILISNDDGIDAPGLWALAEAATELGEVTVVAPKSHQSGASNAITIRRTVAVNEAEIPAGSKVTRAICVDGRPSDCVRLALRQLLKQQPDLVLSGINHGANVGVNVFYSGTAGAAMEGAFWKIPSIACSMAYSQQIDEQLPQAAQHCCDVLKTLIQRGLKPGELININIPRLTDDNPKGIRICEQSHARSTDHYELKHSDELHDHYLLGSVYEFVDPHHLDDVAMLENGYITVTPLKTDLTDHSQLENLKSLFSE